VHWLLLIALAQSPGALSRGKTLADELKYAEAVEVLQAGREDSALPRVERLELLSVLARCLLALGRRPQAEAAYAELLTLKPSASVGDDASPKLTAAFEEVKARLYRADDVALQVLPGQAAKVRIRLIDPWSRVKRVDLKARTSGGPLKTVELSFDETDQATAELDTIAELPVEWFVEAVGADEAVVASQGTAQEPFKYGQAAPAVTAPVVPVSQPRLARPQAWVCAALAVVGLGVGIGLQVSSRQLDLRSRDMTLRVDLASAAHQGAVRDATGATIGFVGAGVAAILAAIFFGLP
jgi:hypothetical protein